MKELTLRPPAPKPKRARRKRSAGEMFVRAARALNSPDNTPWYAMPVIWDTAMWLDLWDCNAWAEFGAGVDDSCHDTSYQDGFFDLSPHP